MPSLNAGTLKPIAVIAAVIVIAICLVGVAAVVERPSSSRIGDVAGGSGGGLFGLTDSSVGTATLPAPAGTVLGVALLGIALGVAGNARSRHADHRLVRTPLLFTPLRI